MPKVTVYNQAGSQVGEIELNDSVFGIEPNKHVMSEVIISLRASQRQGTAKIKIVPKFAAVVVNHGDKKEQAVLVKAQFAHLNGVGVVQYLAQYRVVMHINFRKRCVA